MRCAVDVRDLSSVRLVVRLNARAPWALGPGAAGGRSAGGAERARLTLRSASAAHSRTASEQRRIESNLSRYRGIRNGRSRIVDSRRPSPQAAARRPVGVGSYSYTIAGVGAALASPGLPVAVVPY